ncbi:MAG: gliding motility-associated C-terminal domain-containing protein [Flavobacteriales bacterium]
MKDSLNSLFRARFQGHEAPVDPGTWQAIQGQLVASAPAAATEPAPGTLQGKFEGHEVHVDPAVWQNISAQLGHGVGAGTSGGGFFGGLGWAAAGVAGLLIVGGLIYSLSPNEPPALVLRAPVATTIESNNAPASVTALPTTPTAGGTAASLNVEPKRDINSAATTTRTNGARTNASPAAEQAVTVHPPSAVQAEPEVPTPGAELVNEIIAEMTAKVEEEVRSSAPPPPPSGMNGAQEQAAETVTTSEQVTAPLPQLFLPNTFTPNGDGTNDTYEVRIDGFKHLMVRVYSLKNNQLVFSGNGSESWTGANCEDGMYMVAVEAETPDGRMVTEGKVVWLNRNSMN